MTERLLIAIALVALIAAAIAVARLFVALRKRRVLERERSRGMPSPDTLATGEPDGDRVLCFTTPDCVQCREQQAPALERLRAGWPRRLIVEYVDALERRDLAGRYGILTVPSTVVFADGEPKAVNYGYAPAEKIARQLAGDGYSI